MEESKMNRSDLIAIAKDTMMFTEKFISVEGHSNVADVEVYSSKALQDIEDNVCKSVEQEFHGTACASIYIVNADSFEAAKGFENSLVMNFANAHRPGGGFLTGAKAQEESLCRCSTLYKSISSDSAREMYDFNNTHKTPCDSDYMLLSPNVYVFKNCNGKRLDSPYWTSVITVPAPNRGGGAMNVPQNVIDDVMTERLRKMLYLAVNKGYRNLVLGAWGCGAFGNDTRTVANYFYELFYGSDGFNRFFDNVVFAILGDEDKIEIFKQVFKGKSSNCEPNADGENIPKGYYTTRYDYPVCNHTIGVSKSTLGYTKGILAAGVPFEAELDEANGEQALTVVIPDIYGDGLMNVGNDSSHYKGQEKTNVEGIHYNENFYDCSILDVGMVDEGIETDDEITIRYTDFLIENGLVTFVSDMYNGAVFNRIDKMGNSLVKIMITLSSDGYVYAKTNLDFMEFPIKSLFNGDKTSIRVNKPERGMKVPKKNILQFEQYKAENSVNWADLQVREPQPLTNEMVKDGILKNAQFIFYSEGGAMGNAGDIMTVQKNGDVYKGNYVYGGLEINQIIEAFPYIGSKKFDEIVSKGVSKDGKVHYYYLECGNHLFVRDTVHNAFLEVMKKCKGSNNANAFSWYDMACIVCSDKNR
jgi:uncharacterized protein (TIGR02452 family)